MFRKKSPLSQLNALEKVLPSPARHNREKGFSPGYECRTCRESWRLDPGCTVDALYADEHARAFARRIWTSLHLYQESMEALSSPREMTLQWAALLEQARLLVPAFQEYITAVKAAEQTLKDAETLSVHYFDFTPYQEAISAKGSVKDSLLTVVSAMESSAEAAQAASSAKEEADKVAAVTERMATTRLSTEAARHAAALASTLSTPPRALTQFTLDVTASTRSLSSALEKMH